MIDANERTDHSYLVNYSCFPSYYRLSILSREYFPLAFQSSGRCTIAYSHAAVLSNLRPIPFVRRHLYLEVLNSPVPLVLLDP